MNMSMKLEPAEPREERELITIAEAQKIAPLSKRTYGRMCERGDVKAVKVGKRWLIGRASLMALLGPAL